MPRGRRRKVPAVLSDEEAGPPTPQQQQPEVIDRNCALSDVDSEPDVSLANRKKPRLEDEAVLEGQ